MFSSPLVRAVLLVAILAGRSLAADVVVPAANPANSLIRASTKAEGTGYIWFVSDAEGFIPFMKEEGSQGKTIGFTGPPGKYKLMLVVLPSGDQGFGITTIGIPGPTPGPTPIPNPTPTPTPDPTRKVSQVTYVFEKDDNNPPRPVSLALTKINVDSGYAIAASEFEDDTVNASGVTPKQYVTALAEARKVGLPALVVQSNGTVIRTLKSPTTEAQVLEAAKP